MRGKGRALICRVAEEQRERERACAFVCLNVCERVSQMRAEDRLALQSLDHLLKTCTAERSHQ